MASVDRSPDAWVSMPDLGSNRPKQQCPICGAGRMPPEASGFNWPPETIAYSCGGAYGPPEAAQASSSSSGEPMLPPRTYRRGSTTDVLAQRRLGQKIAALWARFRRSSKTHRSNMFDPNSKIEGTAWEAYHWCRKPPVTRLLAVLGKWYKVELPDVGGESSLPVTSMVWSQPPVALTLPYWRTDSPPEVCPHCGDEITSRSALVTSYTCKAIYFVSQMSPNRGQTPSGIARARKNHRGLARINALPSATPSGGSRGHRTAMGQ